MLKQRVVDGYFNVVCRNVIDFFLVNLKEMKINYNYVFLQFE